MAFLLQGCNRERQASVRARNGEVVPVHRQGAEGQGLLFQMMWLCCPRCALVVWQDAALQQVAVSAWGGTCWRVAAPPLHSM